MNYYFTVFGDVYAGEEYHDFYNRDRIIVIQRSKMQDYQKLSEAERTDDKIREYGWILKKQTIAKVVSAESYAPNKREIDMESGWWNGKYERKVLFVIGAGASAHCVASSTNKTSFEKDVLRPPLGLELFKERFKSYYERYEAVKQSLHFLQDDSNPDVEALFEQEWKEVGENGNQMVMSRHINIQYYLQELLRDVSYNTVNNHYAKNLYASLACELQKIYGRDTHKQFAFVSFNQDTILEQFLEKYFRKTLRNMDDYVQVNGSPFCIFKPHGSWNWGWRFPNIQKFGGNTSTWLFENGINYFQLYYNLLGGIQEMVDGGSFGREWGINKHFLGRFTIDKSKLSLIPKNDLGSYFPALLLPYRDKDEFTMPPNHFDTMSSYIHNVETLIIIG